MFPSLIDILPADVTAHSGWDRFHAIGKNLAFVNFSIADRRITTTFPIHNPAILT